VSDLAIDSKVFQILKIIKKKACCSLDYLAGIIGVSTRTIRNYISQINGELGGIASLVNIKGEGYCLLINDQKVFEDWFEKRILEQNVLNSPQKRMAFIIGRLLNNNENNTLDELAFDMNIGRTTLVNELKKMAVVLESYNLKVRGKQNKGMYLNGNELDLRFFVLDNLYDFLYSNYDLDENIQNEVLKIVNKYELDVITQKRLMSFIIVMLDRFLKNHPLQDDSKKYKKLLDTQDYQIALEIMAVIEKSLSIKISKFEIFFITLSIFGRRTPANNRAMVDLKITAAMRRLLMLIIEEIGLDVKIIHENETFFQELQYHLAFMFNRLMFGLRLKNPLLTDVKEKYPLAYKMAEIAGQVIQREYNLTVCEDEIGYIAFYFSILIVQNEIKVKSLRKVAVICETGRVTAKLVAIQLQRILNQNAVIDIHSETTITKECLKKYDIVFTTVKLSFTDELPVILIDEFFDEKRASKQIEKVTYLQKYNLQGMENCNSILKTLINEEKFFILDSKKSYAENINNMVNTLIRRDCLDENFSERLKAREKKGSMVFARYIALPHTFNYKSDKIELALGVFPEATMVAGKEVKLVFLLGIPKQTDYASLLLKIYDEIIKIATDEKSMNKLTKAQKYEEITKWLEQVVAS
jgi:lichenan operon transcriptional antiterminator